MCKASEIHALSSISVETDFRAKDISTDLTWVDMLKGMAIIGVIMENWINYVELAPTPALTYSLAKILGSAGGICVQVFFILSGFGLTVSYLKHGHENWSWRRWGRRRITKIVVPYAIVIVLSFVLGILGSHLYDTIHVQLSWSSLLAHLTFTRRFYPPSWTLNPSLWFMPVIVGLYVSFPVLLAILEKWGTFALLFVSVIVTYGTLTIAALAGYTGDHDSALFTFWVFPFAFGMLLANARQANPERLRHLLGPGAFLLGVGLMVCSWALRTYLPRGEAFNDSLTSIGIFLILLNVGWAIRARAPAVSTPLNALSGQSYLMYLVHYPIMMFLVGPPLPAPLHPIAALILGAFYLVAVFFLCRFISKPMNRLTSGLYNYRWSHSEK